MFIELFRANELYISLRTDTLDSYMMVIKRANQYEDMEEGLKQNKK